MDKQAAENRLRHFARLIGSDEAYTSTLLLIVVDLLGTEAFTWAPETISLELSDELHVPVPDYNLDKIMAGIALLTTDDFYNNLPRFNMLCNVLADDTFDPSVFDPADSLELAWAITEAALIDPPEDPEHAFSDEIRHYIGFVTASEGIVNPPDVLAVALRDEYREDPLADFADDPEMYSAFWDAQRSKGDEIRSMLQQRLQAMLRQITSLPLADGDTSQLLKQLRRELAENR